MIHGAIFQPRPSGFCRTAAPDGTVPAGDFRVTRW